MNLVVTNYIRAFLKINCLLFLWVSLLSAQGGRSLIIKSPQPNQKFLLDDEIEIEWSSNNISGKISIQYSFDPSNRASWVEVYNADVVDDNYWFDSHSELSSSINPDGILTIRISQGLERDDVQVIIPELASTGSIRFTSKKSYKNPIVLKLNDEVISINEKIKKPSGTYQFEASVFGYGSGSGFITIKPGQSDTQEIKISKTWGDVVFQSKIDSFDIKVERKNSTSIQNHTFIKDEKKITLNQGTYVYSITKDGFDSITGEFTIDPKGSINIPIKLMKSYLI